MATDEWVVYVTGRVPWPPVSGVERRVHQQITMLRERYRVALVSSDLALQVGGGARVPTDELSDLVDELHIVASERGTFRWLRLLRGEPIQVVRAYDRALHDEVLAVTERLRPVVTIMSLVRTAPYGRGVAGPRMVDYCDALSLQFRMRASHDRTIRRWLWLLESVLLKRYEQRVGATFEAAMMVSSVDAAEVALIPAPAVVPIVYDMSEPRLWIHQECLPEQLGPWILMSGDMATDYSAEGAEWFASNVWPRVLEKHPAAQFLVVGRNPSPRILRLAAKDASVVVTGGVPSIREYLVRSSVAVVPLMYGTGVKTRMLEAFASDVPVVATPAADTDGTARAAGAILGSSDPAEFAEHVTRLLEQPKLSAAQARRAREFADGSYGRRHVAAQLFACVESARRDISDRAR